LDIADMYLVICHPNSDSFKRLRLNHLDEEIEALVDCRRAGLANGKIIDMSAYLDEGNDINEHHNIPTKSNKKDKKKDDCDFIL
jgi:hypothetical protein